MALICAQCTLSLEAVDGFKSACKDTSLDSVKTWLNFGDHELIFIGSWMGWDIFSENKFLVNTKLKNFTTSLMRINLCKT